MSSAHNVQRNQVRIIAGRWRGRRLHFSAQQGLRPTPNRLRETLFNWLQPDLAGAHCLDLFAGSGALGFEAISRGADRAVLVDNNPRTAKWLQQCCRELNCEQITVVNQTAQAWLPSCKEQFDVIFLDPPFAARELVETTALLETCGVLRPEAWIYLEQSRRQSVDRVPENWWLQRQKIQGEILFSLYQRNATGR